MAQRNNDIQGKQKTFRDRERERLNNESQNSRGSGLSKININFTGDNPMTSSGTNLAIFAGSPKEENKFAAGGKLYGSNTNTTASLQPKKSL